MLPTKFRVNWPFGSGEEAKLDFQDGCHGGPLRFQIRIIVAIFDLQDTLMLPTKFQVNWPFSSGEEAKNRFSRWPLWRPFWISNLNILAFFFFIYKSPRCFLLSFKSVSLSVQEKKGKIDFQDGHHGSHLGFPTMAAILDFLSGWF